MNARPNVARLEPTARPAPGHPSEAPAAAPKTKIRVDKLNAYFGTFHAIHDITIEIPERLVTAIIGQLVMLRPKLGKRSR